MIRSTVFTPADASADAGHCYAERASAGRALFLVLQDVSPRRDGSRRGFLRGAYREVVARYQSAAHPETPVALLRGVVRALDAVARQVDTRVDDFRGLGIHVLVLDGAQAFLLCGRDAPARVRVSGVLLPVAAGVAGAQEIGIETARAQQDLFSQSLTDSLALYRFGVSGAGAWGIEFFLGGQADEVASALDALEVQRVSERVSLERGAKALLYVAYNAPAAARAPASSGRSGGQRSRGFPPRVPRAALVVSALALAAVAFIVLRDAGTPGGEGTPSGERATQERPVPHDVRSEPAVTPEPAREVASVASETPAVARARGFAEAWQRSYRDAVTSSPAQAGEVVVFGARDGKVYALSPSDGAVVWTHDASGGVGASPLVTGGAIIACDYAGNVVRLERGDGRAAWRRALREKIISTPAATGERVFVGTTHGNVYALSRDSGRVLWKFHARGQIRGSLAVGETTVFVPSQDGRLYALVADTGVKRWSVSLGGTVSSSPAIDGGRVFVGTPKGSVMALDAASGEKRWSYATGGAVNAWIRAAAGRVYAGSSDRYLYCLDARSGDLLWKFGTSGVILSRPEVADGRVVVTSYDGAVYCLDAVSGELQGRFDTADAIFSSPLVLGDRVFFGNNGGRFFGLDLPE